MPGPSGRSFVPSTSKNNLTSPTCTLILRSFPSWTLVQFEIGSGLFFAGEDFDLLEPFLQLLVLVAELVDILAAPLTFFDPAPAFAYRCDGFVPVGRHG